MKQFGFIRDYLTFNRSELRGIIVLLVIFILVVIANKLLPEEVVVPGVNFPGLEKEVEEFEAAVKKAEKEDSVSRARKFGSGWRGMAKPGDTLKWKKYPPKPLLRVDLNRADTLELQRLNGIGPSYARRIVTYRNKLGGFIDCRQLLEVWGIDTALYNLISEHIVIVTDSVKKIDLNTVSFKELLKHPYFPYELTRSVILYRQKNLYTVPVATALR